MYPNEVCERRWMWLSNKKKRYPLIFLFLFVTAFLVSALINRAQLTRIYEDAKLDLETHNYSEAIEKLNGLGDFRDAYALIDEAENNVMYDEANKALENGDYDNALEIFSALGAFKDSSEIASNIHNYLTEQENNKNKYEVAIELQNKGQYCDALLLFNELGDYEDSQILADECRASLQRLIYSDTISAGIRYSAGVTADGNVVFSGINFEDEMVIGTWDGIVSISSNGSFIIGLKNDGTVVTAQRSSYDYRIDASEWHDIVAVASGEHYIVGLRADGTVTAQGHNGDGQIDIDDWDNIIAIDAGWRHTVGLDSYGNVHVAGYASENLLGYIEDEKELWTDLVNISAGGGGGDYLRTFVVGLKADGTAVAVGANEQGQCNIDEWSDLIAISAGDYHTVGLKSDGTVLTTDPDPSIQAEISSWQDIVAISAGYGYTLGLKLDGTVVAAGFGADGQSNVDGWSNIATRKEWSLLFDTES